MKATRRIQAVVLILAVAALIVVIGAQAAFAETKTTKDGYKYEVTEISGKKVAVVTGRSKPIAEMKIPSKLGGYTVTRIDDYAFSGDTAIKTLVIPDTVTEVGDKAFGDCTNITSIKIGSKVKKIGMYGFSSTAITSITFPSSVKEIGESILGGCTKLKKITFSKNLTKIPTFCCNNTAITQIYIPEGVETIGSAAFYMCKSLKSVQCPSTLKYISDSVFYECTALKYVKLPKGLEEIGQSAFYKCSAMEVITLPAGLKYIVSRAFEGCTSLKAYIGKGTTPFIYSDRTMGYNSSGSTISGVVIYGKTGSSYETYANDNGFTFKDVSAAPKDPAQSLNLAPKKKNPIKVSGRTATVKYSVVRKGNKVLKRAAVITIKNKKTTVTYSKASGNRKIVINKKTGKVTVKKGLKKGKYKVRFKVKAAANKTYKSLTKTVTAYIKVK